MPGHFLNCLLPQAGPLRRRDRELSRVSRWRTSRHAIYVLCLLLSVVAYELPSVLTLIKIGWEPIPPALVSDQTLYLNLSAIHRASAGEVLNPWYGTRVRALDVPHLIFPITFILLRVVHNIFGSWTAAVLAWTGFWTGLTYVSAVFCLKSLLPDGDPILIAASALGLLFFQSPLMYIGELKELVSSHNLSGMTLPYLRFAIPQVILPCVLAYWGIQAVVLRRASLLLLAAMALLQFAVCVAFPYFLPVLALGTAVALLIHKFGNQAAAWDWKNIVGFAVVCAVLDFAYVMAAGLGKSHGNVQFTLQFRPEMIAPAIRPYMLLLALAAGLVLASKADSSARSTAAGLALASVLFGFAGVFTSPEAQVLQHPTYVIGIVTWLPIIVALWPLVEKFRTSFCRSLFVSGILVLGLWEAFSVYSAMLPLNRFQRNAIRELQQLNLTDQDMVIAPARFSDDVSAFVPLVSPAKILFTGDAENILSASDTRTVQTSRQALYLMMTGMTPASLEKITQDTSSDSEIRPLLQQTDQTYAGSPLRADQVKLRKILRQRMMPLFSQLEDGPAADASVMDGFRRIFVVDGPDTPFFSEPAFSKWLVVERFYERDGVYVYACHRRIS